MNRGIEDVSKDECDFSKLPKESRDALRNCLDNITSKLWAENEGMKLTHLQEELNKEKEHTHFLERLIKALYGEEWEKLTIYDAKEWHKKHFEK